MSDYLTNLLTRTRYPERTIQPRLSSMFDPVSPGSTGGEVGRWSPEEASHSAGKANEWLSGHDLSASQSPQDTAQSPEVTGPIGEQDIQQREHPLESTAALERWDSSSVTTTLSELEDVAVEATPVLGQVRMKPRDDGGIPSRHPVILSSEYSTIQPGSASAPEIAVQRDEVTTPAAPPRLDDEQRRATSRRNPSDDKAVSLSPIDRSIVGQGGTASLHKPAAQPVSSSLRVPRDEANRVGRSEASPPIENLSGEQRQMPLIATESQARDREPDIHVAARGTQIRASSSPRPLVGAPTVLGDGEPQPKRRVPSTASEPERTIPTSRGGAVGEMPDLRELSLDPSLVSPASAMKTGHTSRSIAPRKVENAPVTAASPEAQEELIGHSLAVPTASKTFIAERHSASPMKAATVSHAMATDRGKSAEPVVQVTIGRVEVRAVAPPVRQEKGRKPQSAMSLDDYLKRRGGRSGG